MERPQEGIPGLVFFFFFFLRRIDDDLEAVGNQVDGRMERSTAELCACDRAVSL